MIANNKQQDRIRLAGVPESLLYWRTGDRHSFRVGQAHCPLGRPKPLEPRKLGTATRSTRRKTT